MSSADRQQIVRQLRTAFASAKDVSPDEAQPLHVLLGRLGLPPPWQPSPAPALVRFTSSWPDERPEFFVSLDVANDAGEPPRSHSEVLVLGDSWRQFSFAFSWPSGDGSAVTAVQLWLTRFREAS